MPTTRSATKYPTATTTAGKRRQVYEGRAEMTTGGLTKADLKENKEGKVVSKKASASAKRNNNFGDARASPFRKRSKRSKRSQSKRSKKSKK